MPQEGRSNLAWRNSCKLHLKIPNKHCYTWQLSKEMSGLWNGWTDIVCPYSDKLLLSSTFTLPDAEADERDSQEYTAFHVALEYGHLPIIRYFLDTYPPQDSDSESVLYLMNMNTDNKSLLRLALKSGEPEVVWLVLESGLADSKAIQTTWSWICANENQAKTVFGSVGKRGKVFDKEKFKETKDLLLSRGGFTPPPTPRGQPADVTPSRHTIKASHRREKPQTPTEHNQTFTPPESPPTPQAIPTPFSSRQSSSSSQFIHGAHDNGRPPAERRKGGRGRGRTRGRGRGAATMHTRA